MQITSQQFQRVAHLVQSRAGIFLSERKQLLVTNRLRSHVKRLGFHHFEDYLQLVESGREPLVLDEFMDRITTNHTYFGRESVQYQFFLNQALPHFKNTVPNRDLRIWCAACSSGEEAYSLLFLMLDFFGPEYSLWKAGILATDISTRMLHKASTGIYQAEALKSVPPHWREQYLAHIGEQKLQVREKFRREVLFRRLNLVNALPFRQSMHAIFLRNVMIYFDLQTRRELLSRVFRVLRPGGFLFLGLSEAMPRGLGFKSLGSSIFCKEAD